ADGRRRIDSTHRKRRDQRRGHPQGRLAQPRCRAGSPVPRRAVGVAHGCPVNSHRRAWAPNPAPARILLAAAGGAARSRPDDRDPASRRRGAAVACPDVDRPERPRADEILLGESLQLLPTFACESFQLVYLDPPFNTGHTQTRRTLRTRADEAGW